MGMITLNGKWYISEEELIDKMVKIAVEYTSVNDIAVESNEYDRIEAFQSLVKSFNHKEFMEKFRDKYVNERFIKRTV